MARINTYALDSDITKSDIVLGSDGGQTTKNFQITEIGKAISKFNIAGLPQLGYFYQYDLTGGRKAGSITIVNGLSSMSFTSLTSIIVSKFNFGSSDTGQNLLLNMVGEEVTLASVDNPNNFGTYQLDSATVLDGDSNFYTLALFNTGGNGSIIKEQFYVLSSKKGDKSFVFTQTGPQTTWNITHNLGKKPSVTVVTDTDTVVIGDVQYTNDNQLTITLSSANSGKAYLN